MIRILQFFDWFFFRLVWLVLFRFKVEGRENIKKYPVKNVVYYSNHSSYFDPFLASINIPLIFYLRCKVFMYLTLRKHAIGKWYSPIIRAMGSYPLPEGKKGYENVMPETIEHVKKGHPVMIFPIPKLYPDIRVEEARPGISHVVEETKATLIPVYIENIYRWKPKEIFFKRRKVRVVYGKPISYEEFSRLPGDYREKAKQLMEIIVQMSKKQD